MFLIAIMIKKSGVVMMDNINLLKSIPLFSELGELQPYIDEHEVILQTYSKGATVHNQNDDCTTLDVVLSGSLVAYALSENGSSTIMFEFKKDNIIGANLLFAEQNFYPLNIYCLSDCQLAHIKKDAVLEFLHNYDFVMKYIKSLSQNSQGLNQKIAMFSQKTLRENILDYLKKQVVLQKSDRIILPISKKELADFLGVQRPSLFREFKKMKEEGIIEIQNRTVLIMKTKM
jgi:CRP-like cAMP-binding protein